MTRTNVPAGFSNPSFTGFMAIELEFDSGTVRLWNGYGDLSYGGNTFLGSGNLLGISAIEEAAEIGAKGASMLLSGISSTILSYALNENYQYRIASIYVGTIDGGTVSAYKVFSGRMDVMTINETGDTCTISITAESRLIDLERPRIRRWTSEDQKSLYAGDKGFDYVNSLQQANIKWGG
jgi:hypothetical protein